MEWNDKEWHATTSLENNALMRRKQNVLWVDSKTKPTFNVIGKVKEMLIGPKAVERFCVIFSDHNYINTNHTIKQTSLLQG